MLPREHTKLSQTEAFMMGVGFGAAHEPVECIKNPKTGEIMHAKTRMIFIQDLFREYEGILTRLSV